jgi:hypothetical protein
MTLPFPTWVGACIYHEVHQVLITDCTPYHGDRVKGQGSIHVRNWRCIITESVYGHFWPLLLGRIVTFVIYGCYAGRGNMSVTFCMEFSMVDERSTVFFVRVKYKHAALSRHLMV